MNISIIIIFINYLFIIIIFIFIIISSELEPMQSIKNKKLPKLTLRILR